MKRTVLEQVSKFLDQERFGSITITKSKYAITIELGSIQTEWSMPPEDIKNISNKTKKTC